MKKGLFKRWQKLIVIIRTCLKKVSRSQLVRDVGLCFRDSGPAPTHPTLGLYAPLHQVLAHAVSIFSEKYKYFVQNMENMDSLFEVSFTKLSETGKALSKCGRLAGIFKKQKELFKLYSITRMASLTEWPNL